MVGLLGLAPPVGARSKRAGAKRLQWDRFAPKGLGISLTKPRTLKMKRLNKKRHGYVTYSGTERLTGTRFTLYVVRAKRTAARLTKDVPRLTGIAASKWLPALALGATRGFAFLHARISRSAAGLGTAALVARHGRRALSYVIVVQAPMAVAIRHLADFQKALRSMKAR
jgi:hypothetical protein